MAEESPKPETGSKRFEQLERNHQELLGYLKRAEERSIRNRQTLLGGVILAGIVWLMYSFFSVYVEGQRRANAARERMADEYIRFRDGGRAR